MSAGNYIPVTEETRKQLHEPKDPSQTYDDPPKQLAQQLHRQNLEERRQELEKANHDEFTLLSDI